MKKEVADAWIADLRTNPPQTTGKLYDGKGYCCLGRLCEVLGHKAEKFEDGINYYYYYDGEIAILPISVSEEAGMNSSNGGKEIEVGGKSYRHLAQANDAGKTFDEIAYAIEKYWRVL